MEELQKKKTSMLIDYSKLRTNAQSNRWNLTILYLLSTALSEMTKTGSPASPSGVIGVNLATI